MFHSLRFRFALVCIGLAVGPLIIAGVIIGARGFNTLEQQSLVLQRKVAESVGSEIMSTIEGWEHDLVHRGEMLGVGLLELKEKRAILSNLLLRQRTFQEVALLDSEGREQIRLSRTSVILDDDLQSRAGNEEFLFPATSGETYLGPVYFDDTIREPLATISVPVFNRSSGELVSVLVIESRFKAIWDLLDDIELSSGEEVYVINQAGLVVAHRHPSIVLSGTTIELPEVDGRAEGLSGTDVIVARNTIQLGNQELVVVAEQPLSSALELATSSLGVVAAVIGAALALAIILALFATRRIVRPIEALATSARAISGGDFSQRVEVSSRDEVGKLADSFNKMAEELRASHEELEASNEELEVTNEELRETQEQLIRSEKLAAIGQLAGGVGHELRNPLGAIKNAVYYIKGKVAKSELGQKEPRVAEFLDIMDDEINSSNKIINDLLGFSRVGKPAISPTRIEKVIEDTLSRTHLPENIELTKKLDAGLPEVKIDSEQIQQVLVNVITNAVQAMPDGGKLTIGARERDKFLEVEIADTGSGIPEEAMDKIFDPLFTTRAKGIGLGLALCKSIIDRHGGYIEVKSKVGKGTTFNIKLPLKVA